MKNHIGQCLRIPGPETSLPDCRAAIDNYNSLMENFALGTLLKKRKVTVSGCYFLSFLMPVFSAQKQDSQYFYILMSSNQFPFEHIFISFSLSVFKVTFLLGVWTNEDVMTQTWFQCFR